MTDTTTGAQPTPPAPQAPPAQQPPAVPTPPAQPATPPAAPPAASTAPATGQQPPEAGKDAPKFTQADLDRIVNDRMDRFEKSFGDKLAGLFGAKPEGDGKTTPEQVLAQAKAITEQAQTRANFATARSFAQAAQIKPERLDALLGMVDINAALTNVDTANVAAVDAAIKAAVDAKAAEFPEFKAGPALPGSSTANPNQPPGAGPKRYSRAALKTMSQDQLVEIADDLVKAQAEGRIDP
jgi:hypothetical protein